MEPVRFAVIGAGFMGRLHARIGHEHLAAQLVAVADIDLETATATAAPFDVPTYQNYTEMLEREQPDAVVIATPETAHRDPVLEAARRGCHIFLEKPIASTLADADAIINACDEHGVKLMIGYILRFEPCYGKIYEAVREGTIGRVLSIYARRHAVLQEGERLAGRTSVINYLAVHDIDQILWCLPDRRVTQVYAKAVNGQIHAEYGVADFTWMMCEFDDGSLGVVECGWGLTEGWLRWQQPEDWYGFGDVKMNVIGTDGVLALDFNPMNLVGVDSQEGWKFPETRHWPIVNDRIGGAARLELEHFFECVLLDRPPPVDGTAGRRSLEVAIAAERSIAEGGEVRLPLAE